MVSPEPRKRGPGRPPDGERAATPAERKAKQRVLKPLIDAQKMDDKSGGIYGEGDAARGGSTAIAAALVDSEDNAHGRHGVVNTRYTDSEGNVCDAAVVPGNKTETASTFQRQQRHTINFKYSEREIQEIAQRRAEDFIEYRSTAEFVWNSDEFVCVEEILWCATCGKPIPGLHQCKICKKEFWSLAAAVRHVVDSIDKIEGDYTHRRGVLKGIARPRRIPNGKAKAKKLLEERIKEREAILAAQARANGWVKRNGIWVRK
jgi:hypothetical protein